LVAEIIVVPQAEGPTQEHGQRFASVKVQGVKARTLLGLTEFAVGFGPRYECSYKCVDGEAW